MASFRLFLCGGHFLISSRSCCFLYWMGPYIYSKLSISFGFKSCVKSGITALEILDNKLRYGLSKQVDVGSHWNVIYCICIISTGVGQVLFRTNKDICAVNKLPRCRNKLPRTKWLSWHTVYTYHPSWVGHSSATLQNLASSSPGCSKIIRKISLYCKCGSDTSACRRYTD